MSVTKIFLSSELVTCFFSDWFICFQQRDCFPGTRSGSYDCARSSDVCLVGELLMNSAFFFDWFTDGGSEWEAVEGAPWRCTCCFLPFSHPWLASTLLCRFWPWSDFCLWHGQCSLSPGEGSGRGGVSVPIFNNNVPLEVTLRFSLVWSLYLG